MWRYFNMSAFPFCLNGITSHEIITGIRVLLIHTLLICSDCCWPMSELLTPLWLKGPRETWAQLGLDVRVKDMGLFFFFSFKQVKQVEML